MIRFAAPLLLITATAASADTIATMPANCAAYLTVQKQSCVVTHHFTCDGDPQGYQRRADYDDQGLVYLGSIDAETRWIESFYPISGLTETLIEGEIDPASFAGLTESGQDSYDFRTETAGYGQTRYVGSDRLTGRIVTIDGIDLEETEFNLRAYDAEGTETWRAAGNEFISREWNMFLSGTSTVVSSQGTTESNETPFEFIFPGEVGFLSVNPKWGCGAVISSAPSLPRLPQTTEISHDNL